MKPDRSCFCLNMNLSLVGAVLVAMTMILGCASVSRIKDFKVPFKGENVSLKKKVAIARIQNISGIKDNALVDNLETLVMEDLTKTCSQSLFLLSGTSQVLSFLENPDNKPSGGRSSLHLAEEGRKAGLNIIVFLSLTGIHLEEDQNGFLWFKKDRNSVKLTIRMEVFDPYTGAKILYENLSWDVPIGSDEVIPYKEGKISGMVSINEAMGEISETIRETLCKSLKELPWKGFIVHSDGDGVEISSGAEVGIHAGDEFVVYENYGTVGGVGGEQYRIPGLAIDELTITAVTSDRARGISASGKALPRGSFIQAKEK